MKFVSPIQNRPASAAPSEKAGPSPQESFSAIFASELRSLSNAPANAPVTSPPAAKDIKAVSPQKVETVAKSSFSQIFPNFSTPAVSRAADQKSSNSVASSGRIVPGIVNIPIPTASAVIKSDKNPVGKKSGSIDIASIVNFARPGNRATPAAQKGGALVSIGDNPSVVVSSRSKTPSSEWDRYRMESSPQSQKGGILAGGVMVAFRIEIG